MFFFFLQIIYNHGILFYLQVPDLVQYSALCV